MNTLDGYKQRIEDVVGPISATLRRKNTMRRELWAHFLSLTAEEGGDDAACARAWDRLGDPAEIRRELDASVPERERPWPKLERCLVQDPGEPLGRFALRFAGVTLAFAGTLLVMALLATLLLAPNRPLMRATVVFSFLVSFFGWLYCLMLLVQPAMRFSLDPKAQQQASRPTLTALRTTLCSMLLALAAAPAFGLLGYTLLGFTLGFRHTETLTLAYMWPLACAFAWVQITAAISFATWYEVRCTDVIVDWPYV